MAGEVESLTTETRNLEGEVQTLSNEIEAIKETDRCAIWSATTLAFGHRGVRARLNERRQKLDVHAREQYDLNRALAAAEDVLEAPRPRWPVRGRCARWR